MVDWGHAMIEIFGVSVTSTVPILLYQAANKRAAKQERRMQHEENARKLDDLNDDLKWLPLHGHSEKEGPLSAECIIRKPNGRIR